MDCSRATGLELEGGYKMNINDFVKLNENGELETDNDAFQSMFTAEVNRAVEKYRNGKGKDEIRKQLEEEAKLTAEEKLKAEREEFEKYKLQTKIEINQAKAKAKLEGKGFTETEVKFLLSTISDNEEKSLDNIDTLIAERTKLVEETRNNAIQGLQSQQQGSGVNKFKDPDNQDKPQQQTKRTQSEILSSYTNK